MQARTYNVSERRDEIRQGRWAGVKPAHGQNRMEVELCISIP